LCIGKRDNVTIDKPIRCMGTGCDLTKERRKEKLRVKEGDVDDTVAD
jgi:hypothetical protein